MSEYRYWTHRQEGGQIVEEEHLFSEFELHRRLSTIGIPKRFLAVDPLECESTLAVQAVKAYALEDFHNGKCLVLTGPTGIGKTFAAVVGLMVTPYCSKRFSYFPGMCSALLDSSRRAAEFDEARTTRFVVWDDFGTEYLKLGGLLDAFLDELIWTREANELPTLITTNLTPDQLRDRLSDRIVDRFRGEWGRVVALTGSSLRV